MMNNMNSFSEWVTCLDKENINDQMILKSLFDQLPLSIYIIDSEYTLLDINHKRKLRIERVYDTLIGNKCYKALYNKKQPCVDCKVKTAFLSNSVTKRTYTEFFGKHKKLWEVCTYPVKNGIFPPQEIIVVERDITHEKQLEDNLFQTEKLAAIGQLAAGIAHEINNPLSAIIANAQLIQRDPMLNSDVIESAKIIEMAGKKASRIIRNLLDLSRKDKMSLKDFNINETINRSLKLLHHEFFMNNINLSVNLESDVPLARISPDHLQGVWINLLLNALDAISDKNGEIKISSAFINNDFIVTITDNGTGMTSDQRIHAFDPFYTTKGPGKGTGLGLSICHQVIKQHCGDIHIESEYGQGTKITVRLPGPNNE